MAVHYCFAVKKMFEQGEISVENFTVHDLRRTFRSLLARLSVPDYVAERCLNHKLKGVEEIYDRYDYLETGEKHLTCWLAIRLKLQ
jgi:integrase